MSFILHLLCPLNNKSFYSLYLVWQINQIKNIKNHRHNYVTDYEHVDFLLRRLYSLSLLSTSCPFKNAAQPISSQRSEISMETSHLIRRFSAFWSPLRFSFRKSKRSNCPSLERRRSDVLRNSLLSAAVGNCQDDHVHPPENAHDPSDHDDGCQDLDEGCSHVEPEDTADASF